MLLVFSLPFSFFFCDFCEFLRLKPKKICTFFIFFVHVVHYDHGVHDRLFLFLHNFPHATGWMLVQLEGKFMEHGNLEMVFGQRLVQLNGGQLGLRGGLQVKTSVPADAGSEPVVEFVSSDETIDRYNEVISAKGWELGRYRQNPVFQDSHDYSTILRTIGRADSTEVRGNHLYQRMVFAVNENPLAKIGYAMYRGGFLHAVSVGFIPIEWEKGDGYARRYLKQELLETSAVAIPANPNALELAYKSGAVEKSDLKELGQILKHLISQPSTQNSQLLCTDPAASLTDTCALGDGGDEAHLVHLMRETAAICRRA